MRNIFLPQFVRKAEIKWTKGFIDILRTTHPLTGPNAVHFHVAEDILHMMKNAHYLCWNHLVVFGSSYHPDN